MPSATGSGGQPSNGVSLVRALPLHDNPKGKVARGNNGFINHSVALDVESGEDEAAVFTSSNGHTHTPSLLAKASSAVLQGSTSLSWFCPTRDGKKCVVVLGSGDFGLALGARLVQADYCVVVGSRNPDRSRKRALEAGASIMQQEEALQQSNVVVMAVPFTHLASLPTNHLAGKVVIDVSNRSPSASKSLGSMSQAEQLQALLPSARVVKAFNVLSAYALSRGNMGSKEVPVCGDDEVARSLVCGMARDLRLMPLDFGRLSNARQIEEIPLRFFPEWTGAFWTSLVVWIFFFIILLFRWQLCDHLTDGSEDWSAFASITTRNLSIACADTSLTLLALCYLPGVIAAYLQLGRGTKYSEFPLWLDRWLKSRKHLGLLMLLNAVLHVLIKLCGSPMSWSSTWQHNAFMGCGCLALLAAGILGVTSLPSVASNMTWREFAFVQSKLGWLTLLLATLHLVFAEWEDLFTSDFVCYLPSSGQFVMVIPLLTLALKVPLLVPCVDSRLASIRQGYEKPGCCCCVSQGHAAAQ